MKNKLSKEQVRQEQEQMLKAKTVPSGKVYNRKGKAGYWFTVRGRPVFKAATDNE